MERNSHIRSLIPPAWRHPSRKGARSVLVVHSSWVWCHSYVHQLKAEGFVADGAPGPIGTTARVLEEEVDVVVLERRLPGVGLDCLTRLMRRAQPNLAVVVIVKDPTPEDMLLPGVDVVMDATADIVAAVREALERRCPLPHALGG